MKKSSIPVELLNPGEVFACLGFLEAADVLIGQADGGFDWTDAANVRFVLSVRGDDNPFSLVLEFLATSESERWGPVGYAGPAPKKRKAGEPPVDDGENASEDDADPIAGSESNSRKLMLCDTFPAPEGDRMSLPIRLGGGNWPLIELGHWADGSSRNNFKLYAGNRSAYAIARAMLLGVREKPKRNQRIGELKTKGISQLWQEQRDGLIERPFHILTPMGGSFNFDPRGAWTAIDAGYSPNQHKHHVAASPVVEFLAAWGLENARPHEFDTRKVRYAAWGVSLPPILARAALCGAVSTLPMKRFRFDLDMSGKNKVVTFAEPETEE
jgi:CRISPR-associated protein Csb3